MEGSTLGLGGMEIQAPCGSDNFLTTSGRRNRSWSQGAGGHRGRCQGSESEIRRVEVAARSGWKWGVWTLGEAGVRAEEDGGWLLLGQVLLLDRSKKSHCGPSISQTG